MPIISETLLIASANRLECEITRSFGTKNIFLNILSLFLLGFSSLELQPVRKGHSGVCV